MEFTFNSEAFLCIQLMCEAIFMIECIICAMQAWPASVHVYILYLPELTVCVHHSVYTQCNFSFHVKTNMQWLDNSLHFALSGT